MHEVSPSGFFGGTPGLKLMWTVRDAEHIVILISIAGGLFSARVWSVAAVWHFDHRARTADDPHSPDRLRERH